MNMLTHAQVHTKVTTTATTKEVSLFVLVLQGEKLSHGKQMPLKNRTEPESQVCPDSEASLLLANLSLLVTAVCSQPVTPQLWEPAYQSVISLQLLCWEDYPGHCGIGSCCHLKLKANIH